MTPIDLLNTLYTYAMVLTSNSTEAEYLVEETYKAIDINLAKLVDRQTKVYLFATLRRLSLTHTLREVSIIGNHLHHNTFERSRCQPERDISQTGNDRMRDAIKRLPSELHEIITLREHEEMSYQEIAEILGCTIETVSLNIRQARQTLRLWVRDQTEQE